MSKNLIRKPPYKLYPMVIIPLMWWGERKDVFVSLKPIEMKLHSSLRYIDRVASIHLSLASRAALSDSDAG